MIGNRSGSAISSTGLPTRRKRKKLILKDDHNGFRNQEDAVTRPKGPLNSPMILQWLKGHVSARVLGVGVVSPRRVVVASIHFNSTPGVLPSVYTVLRSEKCKSQIDYCEN